MMTWHFAGGGFEAILVQINKNNAILLEKTNTVTECYSFNNILGYAENGYIDVGDGCWRRNVLVTIVRCW